MDDLTSTMKSLQCRGLALRANSLSRRNFAPNRSTFAFKNYHSVLSLWRARRWRIRPWFAPLPVDDVAVADERGHANTACPCNGPSIV